eukprot:TRINITY_DN2199_c0_g3_i1.p1 TRINITY_DN2199_c0_g3~~TRINITY_DN2199_c0_g3_i1.p1  ORF type:complete len:1027 (-),score=334.99 TRINITY_DN2199_c0_g3_i1:84-2738(-)
MSVDDVARIKTQLLESNPLLEAFGNATTLRNDNSSRFGKYMEMQFSRVGTPIGGRITNYLLEKSRVVGRAQGERSFHVFYQMLAGLAEGDLREWRLTRDPSTFSYLAQSGMYKVATINDEKDYKGVVRAMGLLGIAAKDQTVLWRVLAAILHLGNIQFAEDGASSSTGQPSVRVKDDKVLQNVAHCLACQPKALATALTSRSISTGTSRRVSTINVPLDSVQAVYSRDALAKSLYERLFQWIVTKVNTNIQCPDPDVQRPLVIGILDIYGFEIFERNSFEQLNINYCNEKLQQLFIELTLKSEQEEYVREGIKWEEIKYFNNKPICDLIEKKPIGIIALLDEACLMAKSTDTTFLDQISHNFKANPHYQSYQSTNDRSLGDTSFRLKHYAGDVTYDVAGFLDKNKDTLFVDLIAAMQTSPLPMMGEMFPEVRSADNKKRPETAGTQFRTAVNALIATLLSCSPHYIRCIKSNDKKQAGVIDDARVRHQVRYLGLLENVRVRRAGFANRQTYERFLQRYKLSVPSTWPAWRGPPKSGCEAILAHFKVPPAEFRLGKTKVFIRNPNTLFMLEEARERDLPRIATLIQKIYRGYVVRSRWQERKAAIRIQNFYRKHKFRRYFVQLNKAFQLIKSDPQWGKTVKWPVHPSLLGHGVTLLHKVHNTWRAVQMVKQLGPDADEVRQKVLAQDIFGGRKPWDLRRRYEADYLEKPSNPYHQKYVQAMQRLFSTYGDTEVLFAEYVVKINARDKIEKRGIVVTNANIYKHDPKNYKVKKIGIPLVDVMGLSLSPYRDTFMLIHLRPPLRDLLIDLGANGHESFSEMATILYNTVFKLTGRQIPVNIVSQITYNNGRPKNQDFTLTFQEDPKVQASTFKNVKSHVNCILYPPK